MDSPAVNPSPPDTFSTVALPLILIFEGLYVNDIADRGGATNHGVTQKIYDSFRKLKNLSSADVKDITNEEVSEIYYNYYWLPSHCDKMPKEVSVVVFDTSVNSGGGRAAKTLQQVLGVTVDGALGPVTLAKLQDQDSLSTANAFLALRSDFYNRIVANDPTQQKFLAGWLRRISLVKDFVNNVKTLAQVKAAW